MNYFPFHVGDYSVHTAHLEPMEDLAYRRLLDQYYLREGPLPADVQATAKLIRMRSMISDVESVLNEFFTLTENGWMHMRCEIEIEHMQAKQQIQRDKANKRWHDNGNAEDGARHMPEKEPGITVASEKNAAAYATVSNSGAVGMPPNTNTNTNTNTNIKEESKDIARKKAASLLLEIPEQLADDFIALRRSKRAPLTQTAVDGLKREAAKANMSLQAVLELCCQRGWTGFKAEWAATENRIVGQKSVSQSRAETVAFLTGKTPQSLQSAPVVPLVTGNIFEGEARNVG